MGEPGRFLLDDLDLMRSRKHPDGFHVRSLVSLK
jgi:hypothetical protein